MMTEQQHQMSEAGGELQLATRLTPRASFIDLALYISVMFLVRELYFSEIGFIANGLLWSLTTLAVATWRMRARALTWRDLGLCRPKNSIRHSYDLSERSITVGLIGLAMGVGYVVFGKNLWPLIVAHCVLNTLSMLDRVI